MSLEDLEKTHFVLLHETVRESWLRDLGSFCSVTALWSMGYFAESPALQWVGVILALVLIWSRAANKMRKTMKFRMTPDEARRFLDEQYPAK